MWVRSSRSTISSSCPCLLTGTVLTPGQQPRDPLRSPETVATSVESPLERHLGKIADVTEMTSQSGVGQTRIVLQFGLDRDIDGAGRDVQAAINAAHADLPTSLKTNPTYWEVQSSRTFSKARGCAAAVWVVRVI